MDNQLLANLSSIRFDSYKSYNNDGPYQMKFGQNITLIIGRNNSGKSSLIDVVEKSIEAKISPELPKGMIGVCPSFVLDEKHIEQGFAKDTYTTPGRIELFSIGYSNKGKEITLQLDSNGYMLSEKQDDNSVILNADYYGHSYYSNWENVARAYSNSMKDVCILRMNAERDVLPEVENKDVIVDQNGNGATNLVRKYLNTESLDESIVEKTILDELNKIMEKDAHFDRIRIQQVEGKNKDEYNWEIFLAEAGHKYAISKSGSGLKTILLILINLYLIPHINSYNKKEIMYAFEEIENNLHPALQRRVFGYLYEYAIKKDIKIIITTHSHIAINTFYGKKNVRIYHVIKQKEQSKLIEIENGEQCGNILDDLGAKASDLFQANGIIWVEGPSDRIYILHWLHCFNDFQFIEGLHFQFMYYGGRLLAHYELKERSQRNKELINMLTINRNAAIVMDSDKRSQRTRINDTKTRVREEFLKQGLFCWITKGKEIENYVPSEAVNEVYNGKLPQIDAYELFPDYISKYDKYFKYSKPDVARRLCQFITVENSRNIMDLRQQIDKLYAEIKKWNSPE